MEQELSRRESYFIKTLLTSLKLLAVKMTCESSNWNNISKPKHRLGDLRRMRVDYYCKDYIHILGKPVEIGSHIFLKMLTGVAYSKYLCTSNI